MLNNSSHNITLFKTMFLYNDIVKEFSVGHKKLRCVILMSLVAYVISLCFNIFIKATVYSSNYYVAKFHERLSNASQTTQMDFLIRFWDNVANSATVHF